MSDLAIRNPPYKGELVNVFKTGEAHEALVKEAKTLEKYSLTDRQLCDLELILNGGFSPLKGFLNKEDYEGCVKDLRLTDGTLWPMPITLDVSKEQAEKWKVGQRIALQDEERNTLAVLTIGSIYQPDKNLEAEKVFGSPDDTCHPAIKYLFDNAGSHYVGGEVEGIQMPVHYDFCDLRLTPTQTREKFQSLHYTRVVGFQTRNPMHRSHRELTLLAARDSKANILIHPVVGMTKPGDVDHYTRVRCYIEMCKYYPGDMATLSLLPLAMRMAGPREALWHAIIRKNYGCTHFVVGRDHAGPGKNRDGKDFYGAYDAQELVRKHADEVGITLKTYKMLVYVEDLGEYRQMGDVPEGMRVLNISGTELRRRLYKGIDIPDWFSFTEVVKILRSTYPPPRQQGFTIFLTGLPGCGKSTIANALRVALMEEGSRTVTVLDSEQMRKDFSRELGFSKEDRIQNIKRIAFVASEITKAGGVAVCSAIAPYEEARQYARELISKNGGYFEVFVSTPLEWCEEHDTKGLYKRARAGELKNFTGIDDPFDAPQNSELVLDTSINSVKQSVHEIILTLEQASYLGRT